MGTPIDFRRIFSSEGATGKHGHALPAQHNFLSLAAHYLNVATVEKKLGNDEHLSDDEHLTQVWHLAQPLSMKSTT